MAVAHGTLPSRAPRRHCQVDALGEAYVGQMRGLLLRMSCVEHDVVVKVPPASLAGAFGHQVPLHALPHSPGCPGERPR